MKAHLKKALIGLAIIVVSFLVFVVLARTGFMHQTRLSVGWVFALLIGLFIIVFSVSLTPQFKRLKDQLNTYSFALGVSLFIIMIPAFFGLNQLIKWKSEYRPYFVLDAYSVERNSKISYFIRLEPSTTLRDRSKVAPEICWNVDSIHRKVSTGFFGLKIWSNNFKIIESSNCKIDSNLLGKKAVDKLIQQRCFISALDTLLKLVMRYPNDFTINYRIGECYFILRNYEKAESYFRKAVMAVPEKYESKRKNFDSINIDSIIEAYIKDATFEIVSNKSINAREYHRICKERLAQYTDHSNTSNTEVKKVYHENGKLAFEGRYLQDTVKHGNFTHYDAFGSVTEIIEFCFNKKCGWYLKYESGQLKCKCNYSDDLLNGLCYHYYQNGNLHSTINYADGIKMGGATFYDLNGQLYRYVVTDFWNFETYNEMYDSEGKLLSREGDVIGQALWYTYNHDTLLLEKGIEVTVFVANPPHTKVKVHLAVFKDDEYSVIDTFHVENGIAKLKHRFAVIGNQKLTIVGELFDSTGESIQKDSIMNNFIVVSKPELANLSLKTVIRELKLYDDDEVLRKKISVRNESNKELPGCQ